MQNILEITDFDNTDITINMIIVPPKFNRMWGADYILMDSKTFMGGKGEADYVQVIDMFQKIWDVHNFRLFSG